MNCTSRNRAARSAAKVSALSCVATVLLFACPTEAAELAILSNGFSIRHEHRLTMGMMTRLYLTADDSSFTDVPTAEITGYEKDVMRLPITEFSAKVRQGDPIDDEEDYAFQTWAGVIPLEMVAWTPINDPRLDPKTPVPGYARAYSRKRARK